jgi:hypothetical protein
MPHNPIVLVCRCKPPKLGEIDVLPADRTLLRPVVISPAREHHKRHTLAKRRPFRRTQTELSGNIGIYQSIHERVVNFIRLFNSNGVAAHPLRPPPAHPHWPTDMTR